MKLRLYTFIILFPIIIIMFASITYKCYSSQYEHHNPLSLEYYFWSLNLPSIGLNGPYYSPPGFTHTSSAYLSSFWSKVVPPKVTGGVSGYRCPVRNSQVGGDANSYHMYGCAADITNQSYESLNDGTFKTCIDEIKTKFHVHIDDKTY
jgi:hypothetical protein